MYKEFCVGVSSSFMQWNMNFLSLFEILFLQHCQLFLEWSLLQWCIFNLFIYFCHAAPHHQYKILYTLHSGTPSSQQYNMESKETTAHCHPLILYYLVDGFKISGNFHIHPATLPVEWKKYDPLEHPKQWTEYMF